MKIRILISLILISFLSIFINHNVSLAYNSYQSTDNILEMIDTKMQKFSQNDQIKKYNLFINIIQKAKDKSKKQTDKDKYSYILSHFNNNLNKIKNPEPETTNITNINQEIIQNQRLELHNQERSILGLNSFIINEKLNNTAQKRANYLAKINNSTHKRKSSDGYYNYDSIKSWFQENGVNFAKEENGIASFSENIARQTFKCTQNDCTQYFLGQTNKTFQFFMSEKSRLGSHYRAIISPHFQEIGFGYAKVGNRFFIVTHYGKFQ